VLVGGRHVSWWAAYYVRESVISGLRFC
jgi:hypothetical protein